MDIQDLNKIAEPYINTLVIDNYTIKRLVSVEDGEEDYYWVCDSFFEGITKSSCCGCFTPLKGFLPLEQYQRLVDIWNLNTDNKAE